MSAKFKSLEEVRELINKLNLKCRWCKKPLTGADLKYYPHSGGWIVEGYEGKLWIYFHCSNKKCGYDWSLQKLAHQAKVEGKIK